MKRYCLNINNVNDCDWVGHEDERAHKTMKCKDCFKRGLKPLPKANKLETVNYCPMELDQLKTLLIDDDGTIADWTWVCMNCHNNKIKKSENKWNKLKKIINKNIETFERTWDPHVKELYEGVLNWMEKLENEK